MKRTHELELSLLRESACRDLAKQLCAHNGIDMISAGADVDQMEAECRELLETFGMELQNDDELLVAMAVTSTVIGYARRHSSPDDLDKIAAALVSVRHLCADRLDARAGEERRLG